MYQAETSIAGESIPFHDAHTERLEPRRLAKEDDAFVGCTASQSGTIDLPVAEPLGTGAAIGAQQPQMGAVDMEAATTVVVRSLETQDDIASAADAEEQIRQSPQVVAPVLERDGIKILLAQQRADIVVERCR